MLFLALEIRPQFAHLFVVKLRLTIYRNTVYLYSFMGGAMVWKINLKSHTAESGGFIAGFSIQAAGSKLESDCFRDPDGAVWRGRVTPDSAAIRDEALRMRMLHEAADAFSRALRRAIDPFPNDY